MANRSNNNPLPAQWKTFSLSDWKEARKFRKDILVVKKAINRVNFLLKKGDNLLGVIQSYVSLMKRIESLVNRGLYAFIYVLAEQLQQMVNNARSTGFYFLDLTSYHFQSPPEILMGDPNFLNGDAWYSAFLEPTSAWKQEFVEEAASNALIASKSIGKGGAIQHSVPPQYLVNPTGGKTVGASPKLGNNLRGGGTTGQPLRAHAGEDFYLKSNEPVKAGVKGKIEFGDAAGYGPYVKITPEGNQGYSMFYGHLSDESLTNLQKKFPKGSGTINAGENIGFVHQDPKKRFGSTEGPHVHIEMRIENPTLFKKTNPDLETHELDSKGSTLLRSSYTSFIQKKLLKGGAFTESQPSEFAAYLKEILIQLEEVKGVLPTLKRLDKNEKEDFLKDINYYISEVNNHIGAKDSKGKSLTPLPLRKILNFLKDFTVKIIEDGMGNWDYYVSKVNMLWRGFSYKQENYYEFIDVINNAFNDPNDKPGRALRRTDWYSKFVGLQKDKKGPDKDKLTKEEKKIYLDTGRIPADADVIFDMFQSGKPMFGDKAYLRTFIVGFTFKNPFEIVSFVNNIEKTFKMFTGTFSEVTASSLELANLENFIPRDAIDGIRNLLSVNTGYNPSDFESPIGNEPNFRGMTVGQLSPDLFNILDRLIESIKNYSGSLNLSIIGAIEGWIRSLRTGIKELINFIDSINNIIEFIEKLLYLSRLFYLDLETNEGVPGIIDQLKGATGMFASKIGLEEVIEVCNLNGNEIASIDGTETSKSFIGNGSSLMEWINNAFQYKILLAQMIVSLEAEKLELDNQKSINYTNLTKLNTLKNQVINFENALGPYYTLKQTIDNQINAYTTQENNYQTQYDNWINNIWNEQTNPTGYKNRKYIEDQIAYFTEELDEESGFNIANTSSQNSLQKEIDELDAKHNDPYAPQNPYYDEERQSLVDQKNQLIILRENRDEELTTKLNTHNLAKGDIDTFLSSIVVDDLGDLDLIDNKIDTTKTEQDELKATRLGYAASNQNSINVKNTQITNNEASIETKQQSIIDKQGLVASKTAAMEYKKAVNPSDPEIAVLQGEIDDLNEEITILNSEITTLRATNETLKEDITDLQEDLIEYDKAHTPLEERKYLVIQALGYWRNAENQRLLKAQTTTSKNNYISSSTIDLNNLIAGLILSHVYSLNDTNYNEVITYLVNLEHFNVSFPDSRSIINAIYKLEHGGDQTEQVMTIGSLTVVDKKVQQIDSLIDSMKQIINKMPSDNLMSIRLNDLSTLNQDMWDPSEKMCYGGFLFAFGYPGPGSFDFNISSAVKAAMPYIEAINGDIEKTTKNEGETWNETMEFFNKVFGKK